MNKGKLVSVLNDLQNELCSNVVNGGMYNFDLENELLGLITQYLVAVTLDKEAV